MTNEIKVPNRRVVATMMRGKSKEVIMSRKYSYLDTAMPRMLQLAMTYCNEGDIVEFASIELGFQLGVLRVGARGQFHMEMSELAKHSPSLIKLMSEDPQFAYRYL